jgi:two-component system response regulator
MDHKVVLLVEDNDDDVELTLRAFKKHNLSNKVEVAHNGQEALDYLFGQGAHAGRDVSELPVLILLDLKLPKVDGVEVLRQIRIHPSTKYIPVVILTTSSQQADKIRCYDNGANSYVRKPVDFEQFTEATRQLGIYWLMINDSPPTANKGIL